MSNISSTPIFTLSHKILIPLRNVTYEKLLYIHGAQKMSQLLFVTLQNVSKKYRPTDLKEKIMTTYINICTA